MAVMFAVWWECLERWEKHCTICGDCNAPKQSAWLEFNSRCDDNTNT